MPGNPGYREPGDPGRPLPDMFRVPGVHIELSMLEANMSDDLHYLDLLEVSARIRRQAITSQAVVEAQLARIRQLDSSLHSFVMVLEEHALAQAIQADKEIRNGWWRGPLHGVPVGVKDDIHLEGVPTSNGMTLFKDVHPDHDATVVSRLRRAGAVLIGKMQMAEGAWMECHPSHQPPLNPWSRDHWTGQSSSGPAVATAAGLCYAAIASDMGGSIRMPCSANSLTGIKPSWGRVSCHGVSVAAESLEHVGPIARSVADATAILQVIAGEDPNDPNSLAAPVPDYLGALGLGVSDLVIGIDRRFATDGVPSEISEAVENALNVFAALGARVREVVFPESAFKPADIMPMFLAELAMTHSPHFRGNEDLYGPRLHDALVAAESLDSAATVRAYQSRAHFMARMNAFFRDIDFLVTPGFAVHLPRCSEIGAILDDMPTALRTIARYTVPFNVAGVPTISLPAGFTAEGLPIGIQLVAGRLDELLLCRAGHAFQTATNFHTRRALTTTSPACTA